MVEDFTNTFAIQPSTPPASTVPAKGVHRFGLHGIIQTHHGSRSKLMFERRSEVHPDFTVKQTRRQACCLVLTRFKRSVVGGKHLAVWGFDASCRFDGLLNQGPGSKHPKRGIGVGPRYRFGDGACVPPSQRIGKGADVQEFHGQVLVIARKTEVIEHQCREQRGEAVVDGAAGNSVSNCCHASTKASQHKKATNCRLNLQEGVGGPFHHGKSRRMDDCRTWSLHDAEDVV